MILTIGIWFYVSIITFICGFEMLQLVKRVTGYAYESIGIVWMFGLVFCGVYAEYFSLFDKVGLKANLILCVISVFFLVLNRHALVEMIRVRWKVLQSVNIKKKVLMTVTFGVLLILFVLLAVQRAHHPDTDLYHAQAIRWIEEYGVVKGLGNLHNRLAYNSAFMCLQALFSFSSFFNQSTHVLNGYIAFGICVDIVGFLLFRKEKKATKVSFFMAAAILLYICNESTLYTLSSPNTDFMALVLAAYILFHWCRLLERKEKSATPYGVLCILGAFAISLKLSVVMIMVLLLKPAIVLIKEKKVKEILLFVSLGVLILIPYFVRNVIISGYLVYPYSALDLFNVDWKMARSVVDYDKIEIAQYGRNMYNVTKENTPFFKWFPIWWNGQKIWLKVLFVLNIILILSGSIMEFICVRKNKKWDGDRVLFWMTTVAMLLFWIITAPLERYGMLFLLLIPSQIAGYLSEKLSFKWKRILYITVNLFLVGYTLENSIENIVLNRNEISLKRPAYYIYRECEEVEWEDMPMYIAEENCYCGYYFLPATPYENILNYIEMRGKSIKDGYRPRKEMADIMFNNSGLIYEEN